MNIAAGKAGRVDDVVTRIRGTIGVLSDMAADETLLSTIVTIADLCVATLRAGNKLLFAGNGGSAADAQHIAAEFVSRFAFDRSALAGISLATDTSVLTAIGNDYGFEQVFARQIEAIGRSGDVFFGITTSGRSPNILRALKQARARGILTVGFTGTRGVGLAAECDHLIVVPSGETAKVQEGHIVIAHTICGLAEAAYFG